MQLKAYYSITHDRRGYISHVNLVKTRPKVTQGSSSQLFLIRKFNISFDMSPLLSGSGRVFKSINKTRG